MLFRGGSRGLRFLAGAAVTLLLAATTANAIYPDGHWKYSTELTVDSFNGFVQQGIDAAPAWNEVAKAFAGNEDVVFGDVNLSKEKIRGDHNPGAGGWPTIRYFNKETGIAGASYEKKTSMSMCDELGPNQDYMQEYIEEAGKTSLCATDGTNCDERSLKYLEKQKANDPSVWTKQLDRLKGLEGQEMKEELKDWVKKRKKILSSLLSERESKMEL